VNGGGGDATSIMQTGVSTARDKIVWKLARDVRTGAIAPTFNYDGNHHIGPRLTIGIFRDDPSTWRRYLALPSSVEFMARQLIVNAGLTDNVARAMPMALKRARDTVVTLVNQALVGYAAYLTPYEMVGAALSLGAASSLHAPSRIPMLQLIISVMQLTPARALQVPIQHDVDAGVTRYKCVSVGEAAGQEGALAERYRLWLPGKPEAVRTPQGDGATATRVAPRQHDDQIAILLGKYGAEGALYIVDSYKYLGTAVDKFGALPSKAAVRAKSTLTVCTPLSFKEFGSRLTAVVCTTYRYTVMSLSRFLPNTYATPVTHRDVGRPGAACTCDLWQTAEKQCFGSHGNATHAAVRSQPDGPANDAMRMKTKLRYLGRARRLRHICACGNQTWVRKAAELSVTRWNVVPTIPMHVVPRLDRVAMGVLMSAHAPHLGTSTNERDKFWNLIAIMPHALQAEYSYAHIRAATDANGRVGSVPAWVHDAPQGGSIALIIGDAEPKCGNDNGVVLRPSRARIGLAAVNIVTETGTMWRSTHGARHHIDRTLIDVAVRPRAPKREVLEGIDLAINASQDHSLTMPIRIAPPDQESAESTGLLHMQHAGRRLPCTERNIGDAARPVAMCTTLQGVAVRSTSAAAWANCMVEVAARKRLLDKIRFIDPSRDRQVPSPAEYPPPAMAPTHRCKMHDVAFSTLRGLESHARHRHGDRTQVRRYVGSPVHHSGGADCRQRWRTSAHPNHRRRPKCFHWTLEHAPNLSQQLCDKLDKEDAEQRKAAQRQAHPQALALLPVHKAEGKSAGRPS